MTRTIWVKLLHFVKVIKAILLIFIIYNGVLTHTGALIMMI